MIAFVTGGTGFVGTQVIKDFIAAGYRVIGLARSKQSALKLQTIGALPVVGDLGSISDWEKSIEGCDVVVHCAAPVELWSSKKKFHDEIVTATKMLLEAAVLRGVKRFIHLSSESVLQNCKSIINIDETEQYPLKTNSNYGSAKQEIEKYLLASELGIDIVVLRPPFVWGVGSVYVNEIIRRSKKGAFVWLGEGEQQFEAVHVKNLSSAIVRAAVIGKGKSLYFVTDGETSTVRDFFGSIFSSVGVTKKIRRIPNWPTKIIAWGIEAIWSILLIRSKPPLTKFEWAFLGMERQYNIQKIMGDLGYKPVITRSQGFREFSEISC